MQIGIADCSEEKPPSAGVTILGAAYVPFGETLRELSRAFSLRPYPVTVLAMSQPIGSYEIMVNDDGKFAVYLKLCPQAPRRVEVQSFTRKWLLPENVDLEDGPCPAGRQGPFVWGGANEKRGS
ncbi:hypothetical protein OSTOST_07148 [Ostertagia ostertagi]